MSLCPAAVFVVVFVLGGGGDSSCSLLHSEADEGISEPSGKTWNYKAIIRESRNIRLRNVPSSHEWNESSRTRSDLNEGEMIFLLSEIELPSPV